MISSKKATKTSRKSLQISNKSLKLNGVDIEDTYKGDKYLHALSKNNNKLDDAIRVGADSKLYYIKSF